MRVCTMGADVGTYVCVVQAFFIIHLQQPAVRDDEWPSKEKGTLSKAKRNRLPHILALLLIHELIGTRASLLRLSQWWSSVGFRPSASADVSISAASQVGSSRSSPNDFARAKEQNAKHAQVWVRRPCGYFLAIIYLFVFFVPIRLLEDTSGLLLMKPELKGSVSMKQWLRFSQWFPIGPPSDTKILKNVASDPFPFRTTLAA